MIELLRRADPASTAVITRDGVAVDYGTLLAQATALAGRLGARDRRRVAAIGLDARDVAILLAAGSLSGTEVCLYPPASNAEDVTALAERFEHDVILRGLDEPSADTPPPTAADLPQRRPLLMLTTGTTGVPRGVRQDWHRLVRSVSRVSPAPEQRWLLAYGLHQFAGLQILLHVFAAGATLVEPAGSQPRDGLAAMRAHGIDHASATPTYWRFLLAELRGDGGPVPHLRQITLGGEAVPASVLDTLRAVFTEANVSQVYAASEFGPTGSMRDGRNGLSLDVLERGEDADVALKVVDGELWVRSRIGMLGYYGEPEVDPEQWRPTGDLVEIVGDRILFRGRQSEVINVGGVKVHPLPIEERVGAVPGVDAVRVYGRANALTGAIVALELVVAPEADRDDVERAVRAAVADLPAAARPRSIKMVDDIAMTGNKIVRRDV